MLQQQNNIFYGIYQNEPIEMKPLNKKKLAENKRKLRELIAQRKARSQIKFAGAYDEVYEKSMATLNEENFQQQKVGYEYCMGDLFALLQDHPDQEMVNKIRKYLLRKLDGGI